MYAKNRTIVSSFVWAKHRNVTDRRTDTYIIREYLAEAYLPLTKRRFSIYFRL